MTDPLRARGVALRAILGAALLVCSFAALAANPYKTKKFPEELARDLGIEQSRVKSYRFGFCSVVSASLYESPGEKVNAPFDDCMAADLGDAYGLYLYDKGAKKWAEGITLKPETIKGFGVAETRSMGATLRELVFELPSTRRVLLWYSGGLLGDHAYPLEIAKRLDEMGFQRLATARFVATRLEGQTIYLR
ncbi:MAG TPA: hypothetical protein VN645_04060 [Steroidobacteraceae bacterium]|nr:hypothetical protein [Steroidobacteraceae bacterium]